MVATYSPHLCEVRDSACERHGLGAIRLVVRLLEAFGTEEYRPPSLGELDLIGWGRRTVRLGRLPEESIGVAEKEDEADRGQGLDGETIKPSPPASRRHVVQGDPMVNEVHRGSDHECRHQAQDNFGLGVTRTVPVEHDHEEDQSQRCVERKYCLAEFVLVIRVSSPAVDAEVDPGRHFHRLPVPADRLHDVEVVCSHHHEDGDEYQSDHPHGGQLIADARQKAVHL